ncbi:MAG: hypothetical protein M3510_04630 [Actinomycetota bacterium]|nr:hypothetical protein [Actinomycetota bacterium]
MHPGPERYADRFDLRTYTDDEPVGVFQRPDDQDAVWLPERLFHRLVAVGSGYDLHLLPLLGGPEPVVLNRQQIQNLRDELALVRAVLAVDPLVTANVTELDDYLLGTLGRPDATVTVEGN